MNVRRIALCSLLLLIATTTLTAQGTYTQLSFPGAYSTFAHGIDAAGDVVGSYTDIGGKTHGFLLRAGVYTTIDYPGALETFLLGINDNDQTVGGTDTAGFVYDLNTQQFTTVMYPNGFYTVPFGINNAGVIVGVVEKSNNSVLAFELIGTAYKLVHGPIGGTDTQLFAISSSGVGVGYDSGSNGFTDFAINQVGKYRDLSIPAQNALVFGINPEGSALIGAYAFSANSAAGFVYQTHVLTTLQFPGGTDTYAYGINDSGQVVGAFNGQQESFLWTPPSDAPKP